MAKSEALSRELFKISDADLRKVVDGYLNECVNEKFFTAPASSTGKYHPAISLGEGGLVRHTQLAVQVAEDLLQLEMYQTLQPFKDRIVAALIIHDTKKSGEEWGQFSVFEHPKLAAEAFKAYAKEKGLDQSVYTDIYEMVISHMGQWNSDRRSMATLPKPTNPHQKFVHQCDYIASRKWKMD